MGSERDRPSGPAGRRDTPLDAEATGEWVPVWHRTVPETDEVRGLTPAGGELYATVSNEPEGPSAVARVASGDGTSVGDSTVHGLDPGGTHAWSRDVDAFEFLLDGGRLYALGDVAAAIDPDGSVVWKHDRWNDFPLFGPEGKVLYLDSCQDRLPERRHGRGCLRDRRRPPPLQVQPARNERNPEGRHRADRRRRVAA